MLTAAESDTPTSARWRSLDQSERFDHQWWSLLLCQSMLLTMGFVMKPDENEPQSLDDTDLASAVGGQSEESVPISAHDFHVQWKGDIDPWQ